MPRHWVLTVFWLCCLPCARAGCEIENPHLQGDTTLQPHCVYQQTLTITRPLTLDCQGAILDGADKLAHGLIIDSRGQPLSGVRVQNCTFRHFRRDGILVHWSLPNDAKRARYPSQAERWRRAPQNIVFSQVRVERNGVAGIVIDDEVQAVTLDRVSVVDNAGWGLYWDHASRGHRLVNSEVRHNGHGSNKPGLAIDGSSDNLIAHTRFEDNRRAAIELYRNCWEFAASNPHSMPRERGANDNRIEDNQFSHEQIGIWIAARQSRDLRAMHCGRPAYHAGRYVEDQAQRNHIDRNRFEAIADRGVIVEDDDNSLNDNTFERAANAIVIGTPIRSQVLGKPVQGTQLQGNQADDLQEPVHFLPGQNP